MEKIQCIDLFSGAGGFAEGFKREGFVIKLANDIWPSAMESYKLNHPETKTITEDVYNLTGEKILFESGLKAGEVDIIIGGPPCQGFSTVGKRQEEDPRNKLFNEYARIVDELKPKYFIMENVKGILSMNKGKILENILENFEKIGYNVEYKILNASDYGVPQNRERAIFIGARKGLPIEFPEATHSQTNEKLLQTVTLEEAISDLPLVKAGEKSESYHSKPKNDYQKDMRKNEGNLSLQIAGRHSEKLLKLMDFIEEGESAWSTPDIPEKIMPKSGYGNTYARLNGKEPGMTITRNFGCVSSSRCIHPKENRSLTMREAARIQSFPDCYRFSGPKTDIALQIGNAVPPLLSQSIGKKIKELLKSE